MELLPCLVLAFIDFKEGVLSVKVYFRRKSTQSHYLFTKVVLVYVLFETWLISWVLCRSETTEGTSLTLHWLVNLICTYLSSISERFPISQMQQSCVHSSWIYGTSISKCDTHFESVGKVHCSCTGAIILIINWLKPVLRNLLSCYFHLYFHWVWNVLVH